MPYTRSQVLQRYRTVLHVFTRYGFGSLVEHLGLARLRPWWRRGAEGDVQRAGRGERLRRALEELGPAFIKLGQMLSTRSDLLPADIVTALERLQDQVSPFPFDEVVRLLEAEFGVPLEQKYKAIDPQPIAAASLGQVHRARLHDGSDVVIKVQRPGVAEQVELDLHVVQGLAALAARRTQWGRNYDLPTAAREFAAMLRRELDYELEGRSAERFRTNFADDVHVRFPAVYWEYTTRRVLTLERVSGLRVTDRAGMLRAGIEPAKVASHLAGALFRMVLRDGFFHADPHPGNLFVGPDGAIIFVDMGMVGELSPAMRENVVDYVIGVVAKDSDRVVQAIIRMGVIRQPSNLSALRREVERLQQKYGEIPLREVAVGPALAEMMTLARRFEVGFPAGYVVLLKSMTTLESVCRLVDPDATLIGLAAPYAELVLQGRLSPGRLLGKLGRELLSAGRYAFGIPKQLSRVLALMEEGQWKLSIDHTGLEPTLHRLSAIANRLAIAILLASLIIGTALVSSGTQQSFLHQYPVADVGFVLIGAVGLWLVIAILGSGR